MALLNKFLYPLPSETETVHTVTTPVVFQHSFRQEERKRKKKRKPETQLIFAKRKKEKGETESVESNVEGSFAFI